MQAFRVWQQLFHDGLGGPSTHRRMSQKKTHRRDEPRLRFRRYVRLPSPTRWRSNLSPAGTGSRYASLKCPGRNLNRSDAFTPRKYRTSVASSRRIRCLGENYGSRDEQLAPQSRLDCTSALNAARDGRTSRNCPMLSRIGGEGEWAWNLKRKGAAHQAETWLERQINSNLPALIRNLHRLRTSPSLRLKVDR